jgi:hypothetical protein
MAGGRFEPAVSVKAGRVPDKTPDKTPLDAEDAGIRLTLPTKAE